MIKFTETDVMRAAQIMDPTVWRLDQSGALVALPCAAPVIMKAREVLEFAAMSVERAALLKSGTNPQ